MIVGRKIYVPLQSIFTRLFQYANILKYVNRLNHLSNYELLIAYTYAEVYLRKFLPLICY